MAREKGSMHSLLGRLRRERASVGVIEAQDSSFERMFWSIVFDCEPIVHEGFDNGLKFGI